MLVGIRALMLQIGVERRADDLRERAPIACSQFFYATSLLCCQVDLCTCSSHIQRSIQHSSLLDSHSAPLEVSLVGPVR